MTKIQSPNESGASSPLIFKSRDRAKFFEIDPYNHMNTQFYLSHFLEHRMTCMREYLKWDLDYLIKSPIAFVVKDIKINFIRSVMGDLEFEIRSHVSDFQEKSCTVELTMEDVISTKVMSTAQMTVVCFDKKIAKSVPWPSDIKKTLFFSPDYESTIV